MPSAKMLNVGAKTVLGENLLSKKTVEQTPWGGRGLRMMRSICS
jgi:hypothetical protein